MPNQVTYAPSYLMLLVLASLVKLNDQHYFKLWMGGEEGSNTKEELLGLWGVLFFAFKCGIDSLIIYGD